MFAFAIVSLECRFNMKNLPEVTIKVHAAESSQDFNVVPKIMNNACVNIDQFSPVGKSSNVLKTGDTICNQELRRVTCGLDILCVWCLWPFASEPDVIDGDTTDYIVHVVTGFKPGAGTDSNVYISIIGNIIYQIDGSHFDLCSSRKV